MNEGEKIGELLGRLSQAECICRCQPYGSCDYCTILTKIGRMGEQATARADVAEREYQVLWKKASEYEKEVKRLRMMEMVIAELGPEQSVLANEITRLRLGIERAVEIAGRPYPAFFSPIYHELQRTLHGS